jgi:UDP-N-acetylmuramoylalanine--D-glutamate ligase
MGGGVDMSGLDELGRPFDPDYEPRPGLTHRDADWSGLRVLVAGLGVSGFAAADALWERGALVTVVDAAAPGSSRTIDERTQILDVLGIDVRLGPAHAAGMPSEPVDLVVTSPGWRPTQPLLAQAQERGIPVWGEVELAWRMRAREGAAPWLTVTGTNGKTTTVTMLASILQASGLRATSAGNVGTPLLEAVLHPQPYDVLAVELSSFQLHWQRSLSPVASACLNVAADHIDWHGTFEDYLLAKGRVYRNTHLACIYNVADPLTEQLVVDAEVIEGCRAVGFTLGVPAPSMVAAMIPGPAPLTTIQPASAISWAKERASSKPGWPGWVRAEPKTVTFGMPRNGAKTRNARRISRMAALVILTSSRSAPSVPRRNAAAMISKI